MSVTHPSCVFIALSIYRAQANVTSASHMCHAFIMHFHQPVHVQGPSACNWCVTCVSHMHHDSSPACACTGPSACNWCVTCVSHIHHDSSPACACTGPKRMRPPQQQHPKASSAFANPSSEIAMQQQMLKQMHTGSSSPNVAPSSPFGTSAHQSSDPSQLHMGPATSGRA